MEVYKSDKKNAKDKPLVISDKNTQKGTTIVLAVLGQLREEDGRK